MMKTDKKPSPYLYDFVKKKVDLAEFLENEIGCDLKWYEPNISAGALCPMPSHKEEKPSFRIKYIEDQGIWIFHCLGCGVKGTIIDFCMEYYGINTSAQAVVFICEKFGFKEDKDLAIACLTDIKKKVDFQKKMEYMHIVTSNQCRMLLRKDYDKHSKWVAEVYKRMNDAMEVEKVAVVEEIGFKASKRMEGKNANG